MHQHSFDVLFAAKVDSEEIITGVLAQKQTFSLRKKATNHQVTTMLTTGTDDPLLLLSP